MSRLQKRHYVAIQGLTTYSLTNQDLGSLREHEVKHVVPGPQAQWLIPRDMQVRSSNALPSQTGGGSRHTDLIDHAHVAQRDHTLDHRQVVTVQNVGREAPLHHGSSG